MSDILSRRDVLAGAGVVVFFAMSGPAIAQSGGGEGGGKQPARIGADLPGDLAKFPLLDAWIRIDAAGYVTVFTGKAELGTGIRTALTQLAADELDRRWTG